jgi:hypothetical protein
MEDLSRRISEHDIKLLKNEHFRPKLGRTARQTTMHKFTRQVESNGNLAIYRRLGLKV